MIEEQEGLLEQTIWSPLHRRSSTWRCTCIPNNATELGIGNVECGMGALFQNKPLTFERFQDS